MTTLSKEAAELEPLTMAADNNMNSSHSINMSDNPSQTKPIKPSSETTTPLVVDSPFPYTAQDLKALVDPKNPKLLEKFGGPEGLCKGLLTDPEKGLKVPANLKSEAPVSATKGKGKEKDPELAVAVTVQIAGGDDDESRLRQDIVKRKEVFGINRLPETKSKSIFQLMWMAFQDKILIFLTVAAIFSFGVGLWESIEAQKHPKEGVEDSSKAIKWVEGVAIIIAVVIVVLVSSINDYQKEKQFRKLNAKKEDRKVKVIRNGAQSLISVYDIFVGDILMVEPGDILAADGVYVSGHNLKCDESAATGESDAIKKGTDDMFLLSGSKVSEGVGRYVVTAIGVNSYHGKTMMALRTEAEATPLQEKLNALAEVIAKLGGLAAITMLITLLLKYFISTAINKGFVEGPTQVSAKEVLENLIGIIITTITVVVVAVPEGLPLAVTLSLAYATTRMLRDNNLVRVLSACEVMGNATTVCSDKTGTLTQNRMTVVAGTIGQTVSFDSQKEVASVPSKVNNPKFMELLNEGIAVNSSAFEGVDEHGKQGFVGSKTETALLGFQKSFGGEFAKYRDTTKVDQLYPFSSERKSMSTLITVPQSTYPSDVTADPNQPLHRIHVKGASEMILKCCKFIARLAPSSSGTTRAVTIETITPDTLNELNKVINSYAEQSLRTIAIAYRDIPHAEFASLNLSQPPLSNLTLLGIVGIEDPLRDGVSEAVARCQKAGVFVRMVTGDNLTTAKAIATKCGIYMKGGIIMEGSKFRKLSKEEMDKVIPRLQVLARSSPTDKQILVGRLKELGETVAVTGDGTNDGPALKLADVGFSMGIAGTEVAKEASSIVLMDDNFSSIVKALLWGRSVNDSVKKFLQFQLTVNVTAVVLTFVSAVSSDQQKSVLTAVQLLWVNLIMDSLAALALATEPPTEDLLDRYPESRRGPLISFNMWKMILGQSAFQIAINLAALFTGPKLIGLDNNSESKAVLNTLVFNSFVFLQLFNEINCRRLDNKLNVFYNIHRNYYFMGVFFLTVIAQVIIIEFGDAVFQTVPLSGVQWAISICIGFLSLPVGVIVRLIPDEIFFWRKQEEPDRIFMSKERLQWASAIHQVRTQMSVFKALRGGSVKRVSLGGLSGTEKGLSNVGLPNANPNGEDHLI